MELLVVSLASLMAGFVDSIVGGGGLILVPALFATFPNTHPATLFGINKSASVWGTAIAAAQYSRRVQMRWRVLLPAALAGFAGSFCGAWAVTVVSPGFLRKLLPLVMVAVLSASTWTGLGTVAAVKAAMAHPSRAALEGALARVEEAPLT